MTKFIETNSRKAAQEVCPWAAKIVKVDGGYQCFETITEWNTWRGQK